MCGCFYIGFIDFMLKGKRLLDYTNLLSPNDYDRNDKLILKYFPQLKKMNKLYRVISGRYLKFEKIFEEEESIEISRTFCLIENI